MEGVTENDIKVDRPSLARHVHWDACGERHVFLFGLRYDAKFPVLEFVESIFNDLMCVITFKIVEYDW